MARLAIPAGSSADLSITVTDPANNNVVLDMSAAIGIAILLYDRNDKVWGKFSQESIDNYEDIDVADAGAGILRIKISEQQTIQSAIGKFFIDIKVTFTDAEGTDTDANFILAKKELGDIIDSRIKAVNTHPS